MSKHMEGWAPRESTPRLCMHQAPCGAADIHTHLIVELSLLPFFIRNGDWLMNAYSLAGTPLKVSLHSHLITSVIL